MAAARGLHDIVELGENGTWAQSSKQYDEFSETDVANDIIIGFNCLVRSAAREGLRAPMPCCASPLTPRMRRDSQAKMADGKTRRVPVKINSVADLECDTSRCSRRQGTSRTCGAGRRT
jgi:hypothetical protein